jgi:intracellular sulfur oxidation DsrE/DsrF family protein
MILRLFSLAFAFCLAVGGVQAQTPQTQPQTGVAGEPVFAEHRLTLQLSDANPEKQSLVLSVAANMLKSYGPDKVAIEVVAFGPGIDLLRDDNPNKALIESLIAQGVRFDACMNTIATFERKTGKAFPLNPHAQRVSAGVERIITLAEHGYITVRP